MDKRISLATAFAGLLFSGVAFADHHGGMKHGMHDEAMHGPGPMFEEFDANKDGKLSRDEVQQGSDKLFKEIDTNKDGYLSQDEVKAHHKAMFEKHRQAMQDKWKAADKDNDGSLTKAEAEAGGLTRVAKDFDKRDKNKDGKLTQDELRKATPMHDKK